MTTLQKVWLVGSSESDIFADIFASEESAQKAVLGYLFEDADDHWVGKLNAEQKCILHTLRTNGGDFKTVLYAYNSFCKPDDQWHVREAEVRP